MDAGVESAYREIFSDEHLPVCITENDNKLEENYLKVTVSSIDYLRKTDFKTLTDPDLAYGVMVLSVNMYEERWNNSAVVLEANSIIRKVVTEKDCQSLKDLFNRHSDICRVINKHITSTLVRDGWQSKAISCRLFEIYCCNLKFPLMSEYLDVVIPPCLLLMDSYAEDLKVRGVKCLHHVVNECGKAELRWRNRANVIYDALQKLAYSREPGLVTIIHPTLIDVLAIVDEEKTNNADLIYNRLLADMYLEDKVILRRAYVNSLLVHIKYLKEKVTKHLKMTMKVVLSYLEDSCGSTEFTRITTLKILEVLMVNARPRIQCYYASIIKGLLRLLIDTLLTKCMDKDANDELTSQVILILRFIVQSGAGNLVTKSLSLVVAKLTENDKLLKNVLHKIQQALIEQ